VTDALEYEWESRNKSLVLEWEQKDLRAIIRRRERRGREYLDA